MKKVIKIGIAVFALAFLGMSCMEHDMFYIAELAEKGKLQKEGAENDATQNEESKDDGTHDHEPHDNGSDGGESEDKDPQDNKDDNSHGSSAAGLYLASGDPPINGVHSLSQAMVYVNAYPGNYHYVLAGSESIVPVTLDNAQSRLTITSTELVSITPSSMGNTTTLFNVINGSLVLDGKVTLNGGDMGSVLVIGAAGSFELNGNAKITGGNNTTAAGGSITVRGTFNMHGGEISGNTSAASGGAVYVIGENANFTMMGGIITGNTTSGSGGGVFVTSGAFNIVAPASTASVYGNTAATYPQVYASGGTFTVNGAPAPNY